MFLAVSCSLCLLAISLWPVLAFRSQLSEKHVWSSNLKDAFQGEFFPRDRHRILSVFGHSRSTPFNNPLARLTVTLWRFSKRFMAQLLFRRVRPVESRIYAFTRNFFSIVAMGILLFRTITALLQAQNELGTRMVSTSCEGRASPSYNITILMERLTYDPRWNSSSSGNISLIGDVGILVSASWSHPRRGQEPFGTSNCTIQWSETFRGYPGNVGQPYYQNRTLELYGCPSHWTDRFHSYPALLEQTYNSDVFVYHIEVRSRTPERQVLDSQMPYVWLLNSNELPSNLSAIKVDDMEVRDYMPPWELLPGSHIEAEAKLVTRRFISSSILKDIILNSEPVYRPLSLYPIAESSAVALNSSSTNNATATIRASLTPGLMFFRTQAEARNHPFRYVCDFIDDYRSGSVLDVIGSVGGLFALLQAIHLLLFGRPLFWGLAGAKLITPFGLFGKCSSRGFKRRLRDEYHKVEDGSDTIQIVKFLRDFVIEFGPADIDSEQPSQQQVTPFIAPVAKEEDVGAARVPLVRMGTDTTLVPPKEEDTDDDAKQSSGRISIDRV